MPTMRSFLRHGVQATDGGLLTQAPPNTGAGWYSLATGAWPGVHGSTNNTFHVNGQPFGNRTAAFDAERAAGRVDRPERRARRAQGRAGRVGRRPQRVHPGPDDRLPDVLLRPRRGDELHRRGRASRCSTTRRSSPRSACSSTIPPATPARRRSPAPRRRRRRAGPATCRARTARRWRCGCACSTPASTSTASTPTSSTPRTTSRTNYDKVLFSRTKDAADAVGTLRKGQWADVKVTIQSAAPLEGQTAGMLVKVEELTQRPVARPPLPHLGHAGPSPAGRGGPASRASRRLRRVPGPEVPDLDGGRLRDPRGRHHQRGDVRRAGPVLGDRPPADARVRREDVPARTCCSSACRRRTSSSTSSSGSSRRSCRTARRTRPTTTST